MYADWECLLIFCTSYAKSWLLFCQNSLLDKESVESIGGFHALPDYDIESVPKGYDALILVANVLEKQICKTDQAFGRPLPCLRKDSWCYL